MNGRIITWLFVALLLVFVLWLVTRVEAHEGHQTGNNDIIKFLTLQALDGHYVHVNKAVISTISEPRVVGKMGTDKFNCIVGLVNGKYIAVFEKCESVQKRLKGE